MSFTYFKQQDGFLFRQGGISVLTAFLLSFLFIACEKEKEYPGNASLCIVNAVPDSRPLVTNFAESGVVLYKNSPMLYYNSPFSSYNRYSSFSGNQRVRLFQLPDTTDKDIPLFDLRLEMPVGTVNSLFLTGTLTAPDTVFTRDEIPYFATGDSVMGVRFVHLSAGSRPVSINIKGLANPSEISSLAYKSVTGFKRYPVTKNISGYIFEVRDAVTGVLITSYDTQDLHGDNAKKWLYRSVTVVFMGVPGGIGANAQTTLLVTHFRAS